MTKLSKQHFWEWFKRHHQEFTALRNKSKKEARYWMNELTAHLRAYYKFFGFAIEWRPDQTATLTITVNAKAVHFPKVDALVAVAPVIPGWYIAALESPKSVDFALEQKAEATGIDPRELYFCFADDDPGRTDLVVYHPLCTPENKYLLSELANAAIYNLLGERCFGTEIRYVEVANLSTADTSELHLLETLPECMDLRRSAIVVDRQGKLVDMR